MTRQSVARYVARARVSVSHIFEASLSNIVWLTYQRRSRRGHWVEAYLTLPLLIVSIAHGLLPQVNAYFSRASSKML